MNEMKEFIDLFIYIESIVESDFSWEKKHDFVFSKSCSVALNDLFPVDWDDPDTDYEDEVMAFYLEARNMAGKFLSIINSYNDKVELYLQ